ncbi:MAG: DegT/DnrJ/EryC1/StrS family aminotransferase [Desulfovibrio sp.]|jgi:perosamine synthetase|nr:DegT/DnrJ/EryC1/StrS family aminotransferase [Desulfovibrio sp.]
MDEKNVAPAPRAASGQGTAPYVVALNNASVTQSEIARAAEALASAGGVRSVDAIHAFQRAVARCAGRQYAYAVSGGRAAYFLALRAMGIGPGDEVLLPEGADFAPAAAVLHCGAVPVFCDLDPTTFTVDAQSAAARIGPRTRCLLAAHMYGLPCDMRALEDLARRHRLFLLEDAASGFGGVRQGRAVGSCGDASVFTFTDTSLVRTGGCGMLLSSSRELMDRAARLGGEGRGAADPLACDFAGRDFAVSGLAAAVGLAQLERLQELLEGRKRVFAMYGQRLGAVPCLRLNPEISGTRNSFLMPFIILERGGARDFAHRLQALKITARPALTPLSSMPLFSKADNPVAYAAADRLLLLPGGHDLSGDEADYVAGCVTMLLRKPQATPAGIARSGSGLSMEGGVSCPRPTETAQSTAAPGDGALPCPRPAETAGPTLTGRLAYEAGLRGLFTRIKTEGCVLPFTHRGRGFALSLITREQADDPRIVHFLRAMRRANAHMFLYSPVNAEEEIDNILKSYKSPAGTAFLLFLIREEGGQDADGAPLWGHLGLSAFDFKKAESTLDALVLREGAPKGLMGAACETLYAWCAKRLGLDRMFVRVRGDNTRALLLAFAAGYAVRHRQSMRAYPIPQGKTLRPMYMPGREEADGYLVTAAREL